LLFSFKDYHARWVVFVAELHQVPVAAQSFRRGAAAWPMFHKADVPVADLQTVVHGNAPPAVAQAVEKVEDIP
jgi:hypothetical protein